MWISVRLVHPYDRAGLLLDELGSIECLLSCWRVLLWAVNCTKVHRVFFKKSQHSPDKTWEDARCMLRLSTKLRNHLQVVGAQFPFALVVYRMYWNQKSGSGSQICSRCKSIRRAWQSQSWRFTVCREFQRIKWKLWYIQSFGKLRWRHRKDFFASLFPTSQNRA